MIEIITDSTCDLPAPLAERYGIQVIPYMLMWNNTSYRDRVDISPEAFYARLRKDPANLPTTGISGPGQFVEAYAQAHARGASQAVVITIGSRLSGAAGLARQAAEQAPLPVHIHESGGLTMGMGFQVLAAARASAAGASLTQVLAEARRVRERVRVFAYLETLDFAYRGGRLSRVSWMVGSALNIKGVVEVDHSEGIVKVAGRAHGRGRGVDLLYQLFFARMGPPERQHVIVLHGDAQEAGQNLLERVRSQVGPGELLFNTTGPILGAHTGPGALALAGYSDSQP